MPIYDYFCPVCGKKDGQWASIGQEALACDACGSVMTRLFTPPTSIIPDIEPHFDEHMGHEPVLVTSRQHKKALLRERGLVEIG